MSLRNIDVLGREYLGVSSRYLREEGELACLCLVSALVIQPVLLCSVLRRFVHVTRSDKHLCNFVYRIMESVFLSKFCEHALLHCCERGERPCVEAKGHVGPSSSQWFVLYGLDRVGCLALTLGLCRCVDDLESK